MVVVVIEMMEMVVVVVMGARFFAEIGRDQRWRGVVVKGL